MLTCLLHIYTCQDGDGFHCGVRPRVGGNISGQKSAPAGHAIADGTQPPLHETGQQFSEMCVCVFRWLASYHVGLLPWLPLHL